MKTFLAVVVVAFAAADSQACFGQRRAARQSSKKVEKTKTVERTRVLPVVREVVAAPLNLVIPCPNCK